MNVRLQALFSSFPDLIIFNSYSGRTDHLVQGFPPQRSLVIHSGVDVDKFRPDQESGISVRKGWNIDDDTVLIGLVGRFDPLKDHETFVKAAVFLAAEAINCCFVFIGDGPVDYVNSLRRIVAQYNLSDHVVWAGARADMPAVYNALDIACLSSISEGLPISILEAMACDVPCVVTDVGDSALLVGDTGIVVPSQNPEALAAGLKQCIGKLRAGVVPDPRQRILNEFDLQRLVERTEAAVGSLVQT
jgi:glycosyltransferase involved in cell wall biosynthesis